MCTAGQKVQIKAQLSSSSCLHKVEHVAAADVRKLKYFMLKKTFSVGVLSDGAEYAYNSMQTGDWVLPKFDLCKYKDWIFERFEKDKIYTGCPKKNARQHLMGH